MKPEQSAEYVRCAECSQPITYATEWTADNQWQGLTLYCSWACRETHFDGTPTCPDCNDEGILHTRDGEVIGPCHCARNDGSTDAGGG